MNCFGTWWIAGWVEEEAVQTHLVFVLDYFWRHLLCELHFQVWTSSRSEYAGIWPQHQTPQPLRAHQILKWVYWSPYLVFAVTVDGPRLLLFLDGAGGGVWGRVSIGGMGGTRHLSLLWRHWSFCWPRWIRDWMQKDKSGCHTTGDRLALFTALKSDASHKLKKIKRRVPWQ